MSGGLGDPPTIRPISKTVVHRICAGQVILDLSSAVKELVENSLDAGSTSIEISLKDYGLESFQVIDNGSGVSPHNFNVLVLKHHTSKLLDFPDLQSLATFGFRGEALSSLCALGDLTVETRTVNETVATHLTYDRTGLLTAERKTARQVGTTVTVKKLFSNLPVRSKEFQRNIRKEYGKLINLLNAYALISKGVRFVCTNTTGKNIRSVVLKTQGNGSLKENIITVFGMTTFSCLESVKLNICNGCIVEGFVSKSGNGCGRNMGDRQFFFVNGRPVDMPKVGKLVNELYRSANSRQYPVAIMNFCVPTKSYDVNVTPDKRKIFFSDENSILQSLREALENVYSSNEVTYSVNTAELKEDKYASVIYSSKEKSELPSEDSNLRSSVVSEGGDAKLRENGGFIKAKFHDDVRDLSDKEMVQSAGAPSMIEGFALGGQKNRKTEHSSGPEKKVMDFTFNNTQRPAPHGSKSTQMGNISSINSRGRSSIVQMSLSKYVSVNKRKYENSDTVLSEMPLLRSGPEEEKSMNNNSLKRAISARCTDNLIGSGDSGGTKNLGIRPAKVSVVDDAYMEEDKILSPCGGKNQSEAKNDDDANVIFPCIMKAKNGAKEKIDLLNQKDQEEALVRDSTITASVNISDQLLPDDQLDDTIPLQSSDADHVVTDVPVSSSGSKVGFTLEFSLKDLMSRRKRILSRRQSFNHTSERLNLKSGFASASLELSQIENDKVKDQALAAATSELERLFKKEDFKQMTVIGQFNLGFIIGKLYNDLFIVDQHAADEKYNYERLSQSTILNQQPLLRPLRMDLSPEEEIVVSMHSDIFRKNGFILQEDMDAPSGKRFLLKAIPFSKNITFGIADVKELISILNDNHGECSILGSYKSDTVDSLCPPRVRAMLASRACRSSIMIGDSLGRSEMQKILEHLATLKSPWNCPHGRPTMRHLIDLKPLHKNKLEDEEEAINL